MAAYDITHAEPEAKDRYKKKLQLLDLETCPYLLPADSWIDDPTQWPELEWPEVHEYLLNTPGIFTKEAMNNRKSLEA